MDTALRQGRAALRERGGAGGRDHGRARSCSGTFSSSIARRSASAATLATRCSVRASWTALGLDDGNGCLASACSESYSRATRAATRSRRACVLEPAKLRDVVWSFSADEADGGRPDRHPRHRARRHRRKSQRGALATERTPGRDRHAGGWPGARDSQSAERRAAPRVVPRASYQAQRASHRTCSRPRSVVGDEIKRLANLVTEFLDFARPKPPELKPTSLSQADGARVRAGRQPPPRAPECDSPAILPALTSSFRPTPRS